MADPVDLDGPEFHRLPDAGSALLDPFESPLLALMAKTPTVGEKVAWFEDECWPRYTDLLGSLWFWSKTARVPDPRAFRVGDVLRPLNKNGEGREAALVESIDGDRIVLKRRIGSARRMLRARSVYLVANSMQSWTEIRRG